MKARATIICSRDGKVLLVARTRSRWSLPGGTIKPSESPLDAARRELEEETSLVGAEFTYLFQFGGLNKRHLVFSIGLPQGASPEPCNEISKCRWFSPIKISMLVTSIPTREIVDLFCTHKNRGETPPAVIDKRDGPVAADVTDGFTTSPIQTIKG
ncbi:NUDIX hydrolase [Caballeronia sp. 15715]|uniref:NUDIX hydrolase n=1 Tax=unclassified Caballeronia TaxID=2646786 RepID=UPI0039E2BA60